MSRVKGSNFDKLVEHLNSYKAGDEVLRKDLLKVIYEKPDSIGYPSTVDKWRRQLTICEYLEETKVPGRYRRTGKYIPDWLTSSELENLASLSSRDWYERHKPIL